MHYVQSFNRLGLLNHAFNDRIHDFGEHRVELLNIICFIHLVLIRQSSDFLKKIKKNRWNIGQIVVHNICVYKINRRILCMAECTRQPSSRRR